MKRISQPVIALFAAVIFLSSSSAAEPETIPQGNDRFIVTETTVYDTESGLMWAAHDNGADISLFDGKTYCDDYTEGGFDDWRLPTQQELATLFDVSAYEVHGYYITTWITITGCCLWASDSRDARVATFDFAYGNPDWGHPMSTIDARVLPVRDGETQNSR